MAFSKLKNALLKFENKCKFADKNKYKYLNYTVNI